MARHNSFGMMVPCPHCRSNLEMWFAADIGALEYKNFQVGDLVIPHVPPDSNVGQFRHTQVGPDLTVDWYRPFWVGGTAGSCPVCNWDVFGYVDIVDRRFARVRPTADNVYMTPAGWDVAPWGYLD